MTFVCILTSVQEDRCQWLWVWRGFPWRCFSRW